MIRSIMKKIVLVALAALMVIALGCSSQFSTYDSGVSEMKKIQAKYGSDFEDAPVKNAIPSLVSELSSFQRKIIENDDTKPLMLLTDYRIKVLESDRLLLEGFKWGDASTTEKGFGCRKGSERILNSSQLRTMAAEKGNEAIVPLQQFVSEYPEKASALNLTQRTILSLSTTYAIVAEQAQKDKGNVEGFCENAIEIVQDADGLYHVTVIDDSSEE
jgi:hypothetical protein